MEFIMFVIGCVVLGYSTNCGVGIAAFIICISMMRTIQNNLRELAHYVKGK